MSILAINRSVRVLAHLRQHGPARFKDFAALLAPISPTALSLLLSSLIETGELVRDGRVYHLALTSVALPGNRHPLYRLPARLRLHCDEILASAARDLRQSCAMFARVGTSTMKIVSECNLPNRPTRFAPLGYEWPLVPFHGFAQTFLAYETNEDLARDVYYRWRPYLHPQRIAASYRQFSTRLRAIRRQGFTIEYKEETGTLMRIVVPVRLEPEPRLRFAVGLVAHPLYLLEVDRCVKRLLESASDLSQVMARRVPDLDVDEKLPLRPIRE